MFEILFATIAALLAIISGYGYLYHPNAFNPPWLWLLFGIAASVMSIRNMYFWLVERGLLRNWS